MTTKNALKKLAAKNILAVETSNPSAFNRSFYAIANGYRLEVTTQGEDVSTMRVARSSDRDEWESDYFAGSHWDTMPQVFRAMGLSPARYSQLSGDRAI